MKVVFALIRKNLLEGRWVCLMIALALYWLAWLFVWVAHRMETRPRFPVMASTIELEMQAWERVPLFMLLPCLWAIVRGTSIAGEIERGTIDLVLSRPVRRSTYLFAQVLVSTLGLALILAVMLAGNQTGAHFNTLREAPSVATLLEPTLNLLALGWAVYGYTFLCSTLDIVRWRPILISSVVTIASYIGHIIANTPMIADEYKWIDRASVFRACRLVEVVTTGQTLNYNITVLTIVGLVCVVAGFIIFSRRDLPAGS